MVLMLAILQAIEVLWAMMLYLAVALDLVTYALLSHIYYQLIFTNDILVFTPSIYGST